MLVERSMHPEWLSNAYAVADRQGGTAVFVDSGADVAPLVAAVEGWGAAPAAILRTHSHHDHVVHEDDLRDRYGIPVIHTVEALPAAVGDLRLRAIFTPGHADDHLAFVFDNEAVFTGDVLFKDAVGGGDLAQVRASVLELLELPGVLRRLPGSHRRDDDRPRARVEPVRPRLARDGAGGDGAGARRRPRRDARRLVAGLRRQGQGLGPLRRRHGRDRWWLPRRAVILAIDQGTSGTTCLVVDEELEIRGRGYVAVAARYPQPGWVEQDPEEIWSSVLAAAEAALASAGLRAADLTAIGITNQRETTIVWERRSGRPLQDAIVWQDRRTAERCRELPGELIRERTGLVPDPYFSATKLEWLLARAEQPAAELAFGTVDSWLVWKLTGGGRHVTDVTNAARTMLFDIGRLAWDDELLDLFGVEPSLLPEVVATSGVLGEGELFGAVLPIASLVGDQQAALFGQGCFEPREAKATYGTGSFVLVNVGGDRGAAPVGLLKTVAAVAPGHDVQYAVEGSVLTSGAVVQWLRDGLGIAADADEVERLAVEAGSSGGVTFVPALAGLGSPYWDPDVRGLISGITGGTTRGHIARATLEAIAHQVADVLEAHPDGVAFLRADGGASRNAFLMQLQADLLERPVEVVAEKESTAVGAAALAGLATGVWPSPEAFAERVRRGPSYEPSLSHDEVEQRRAEWRLAVARARMR